MIIFVKVKMVVERTIGVFTIMMEGRVKLSKIKRLQQKETLSGATSISRLVAGSPMMD